jgi:hypothetical protein
VVSIAPDFDAPLDESWLDAPIEPGPRKAR